MRSSSMKVLAPALVCLAVAGCGGSNNGGGGGGGGGNTNPTTVTLKFYDGAPAVVATQVGTGSFTAASVSSNTVTLSIPNGTKNFAAAWACPAQVSGQYSSTYEYVIESTTSDATSYNLWCPPALQTPQTGTLTLSVDASAFSDTTEDYWTFLAADAYNASGWNDAGPPMVASDFTMAAPVGTDRVDLIVTGETLASGTAYLNLVAIKSFTGVTVPGSLNGGDAVKFTSADAAVMEPITYKNLPADYNPPNDYVLVWPAGETDAIDSGQGPLTAYPALPATLANSADQYEIQATSYALAGSGAPSGILELVSAQNYFQGEGPITLTFPAPWTNAGPTPAALPTLNIAYSGFTGQSDVVGSGYLYWYLPSNYHTSYSYWVDASSAYLNGSTTLQFPELSQLPGFIPDPVSGAQLNWQAGVCQGAPGISGQTPTDGNQACVQSAASYTVP